MTKTSPKVIFWDIETSPLIATIFSLKQKGFVHPKNVLQDLYMISAAWKVMGEKQIKSVSLLDDPDRWKKDITDDYYVVKTLHEELQDADIIVGHHSDAFDWKKFNTRVLYHGLDPLPPIKSVDTCKLAKKYFSFTSNSLDYISSQLGGPTKGSSDHSLWKGTIQGDETAIKKMVVYNIDDIPPLEYIYMKMRPFHHSHPSLAILVDKPECCPKCTAGKEHIESRGIKTTNTRRYRQFFCKECRGWFSATLMTSSIAHQ